jgi:uncharacterized RDD family membrane protein YckC
MEIGLRILALIIDIAVCFGSLPLILYLSNTLIGSLFETLGLFAFLFVPLWISLFFIWPLLCLAIPTGIWGKSAGKFICRLKVTNYYDRPPGFWRAAGREALKLLALASGLGAILTLFLLVN